MEGYRTTVTLLAAIAVFVLVFNTNMETCSAATTTTTKFIQTSCNTTTYPKICIKSLSSYSNKIKTSYRMLCYTALTVSLKSAAKTSTIVTNLSRRHDLKPSEAAAVKDCVEDMGDSIDELRQSLKEMKNLNGTDFDNKMSNIKTWVSAALTDDDTCMEGVDDESLKGSVRTTIRNNVVSTAQLTTNALAIVNSLNKKYLRRRRSH
ncbi:Pectinesterase inhibitor domain [Macleaya cordata]|uniref:Pectinesterase inhibitor domain n=1 Tax=Macleaya cordata TaxID=56857 RepID=A0A200PXN7_MACCD|nr:Pectinesterase inhibitor domain [Macleaya cordata]